VTVMCTTEGL